MPTDNGDGSQCTAKELDAKSLVKAALNDDEGAINCFRQQFYKMSEQDKAKLIDAAHREANSSPEQNPAGDPSKVKVMVLRPIFDANENLADLDIATFTRNQGLRQDRFSEEKRDLKVYDFYNSGTDAGKEIQSAQDLQAKVAPYARAYHDLLNEVSLTDEGLTSSEKFFRGIKKYAFNGYGTDKYIYDPLSAKEERTFYQNFLKTAKEAAPSGFFDERTVAELARQVSNSPVGLRNNDVASDKFGLHTNYYAHTGELYDAYYMQKLPDKFEMRVKAAHKLHEDFWAKAKYRDPVTHLPGHLF